MEPTRPDSPLTLRPFDPETFQRVWNRVMPDQAGSPIAVNPPDAVPALSPPDRGPCCLGEGSPYVQSLEDWMEETQSLLRAVQDLARRTRGRAAYVLSGLVRELSREQRRLSAAHFLITGVRFSPSRQETALSGPLDQALRTLFQRFRRRADAAQSAAGAVADSCLSQLFAELGDQAEQSGYRLWRLLETQ